MSRQRGCTNGCSNRALLTTGTVNGITTGISTSSAAPQAIIIIGDTVAAVRYAARLLCTSVSSTIKIYILVEGGDVSSTSSTSVPVQATTFPVETYNYALHFLQSDTLNPVLSPDEGDVGTAQYDRSFRYYYGTGTLGDFVSSYYIPRLGPWLNDGGSNSTNIRREVSTRTTTYCPTAAEEIIIANLVRIFDTDYQVMLTTTTGINYTTFPFVLTVVRGSQNPLVDPPAIFNKQVVFVQEDTGDSDELTREIYLQTLQDVMSSKRVVLETNVNNLKLTRVDATTVNRTGRGTTVAAALYNATYTSGKTNRTAETVQAAQVVFKTNPYQALRLGVTSGYLRSNASIRVPVTYRAVLSISTSNVTTGGTVTLPTSNRPISFTDIGDGVTSYITMGLPALVNSSSTDVLKWCVGAYTTDVDRADPSKQGGVYASTTLTNGVPGTLLIVEAVNLANRRVVSYGKAIDSGSSAFVHNVMYNSSVSEAAELTEFTYIVAAVYNAYTGQTINVTYTDAENVQAVCTSFAGGATTCTDTIPITSIPTRETPINTLLETYANLYNPSIYPTGM
jgi:hypothetical protein